MRFLNIIKENKIIFLKLLFLFIILISIILSIYSKTKNIRKTSFENKKILKENREKKDIFNNKRSSDVDNDGLLDWEEVVYGTDINNIDTDGDGVSDYNEVFNNKDPLVKGDGKNDFKINNIIKRDGIIQEKEKIIQESIKKEKHNKIVKEIKQNIAMEENLKKNNNSEFLKNEKVKKKLKKEINDIASSDFAFHKYADEKEYILAYHNIMINSASDEDLKNLLRISKEFKRQSVAYSKIKNKINNKELKIFLRDLEKAYAGMSNGLKKISEKNNKNGGKEFREANIEYNNSATLFNITLSKMNDFIMIKNLKFDNNEPGIFFEFSL